jgi:hypothetical protein
MEGEWGMMTNIGVRRFATYIIYKKQFFISSLFSSCLDDPYMMSDIIISREELNGIDLGVINAVQR